MKNIFAILFCVLGTTVLSAERSTGIVDIADSEFVQAIDSGLVLVDFWATWCAPCVQQGKEIAKLAPAVTGYMRIYKMDVDKNTDIPTRFLVTSIPTLIIFKDGKMVNRLVGLRSKAELEAEIEKLR